MFLQKIFLVAAGVLLAYMVVSYVSSKNTAGNLRKKFFPYLLTFLGLAIGFEFVIEKVFKEPTIITQAIEQLSVNPVLKKEVGNVSGYGYNNWEIENIHTYPADLELKIFGDRSKEVKIQVTIDTVAGYYHVRSFSFINQ